MPPVFQRSLPYDPFSPRPLPGIAPLDLDDWIRVDEAYAGQMARREALISDAREVVIVLEETAREAAEELLDLVVRAVLEKPGFAKQDGVMIRPDGGQVMIARDDPLGTLGRLVQEDFCLLQKRGDEHVLTGAVLCFPASWSLEEKYLRPLIGIHDPVESYDADIAKRVQRLFDGVQATRPLWRFNALWYADPELHQPRREDQRRDERYSVKEPFLRSEMQTIRRLPVSGAVVFGIHTYVVKTQDLPEQG